MKKKLLLACLIVLALCTLGLASCGLLGDDDDHTHAYGEWTTVTEPTCTTEGSKERVCSCGEKETETISATGHTFGTWTTVTEPTCTTEGSKERVCSCGEKETETISATGHTFSTWTTVTEPTCTTEGSKERVCSCGEKETETISATGHTFGTWTTVTEPTCTTEGSKERVCSCGEKETETISATGHTFGEWITLTEPTCTSLGYKERVCSCGEKQQEMLNAMGHNIISCLAKAPTCSKKGHKAYEYCDRDGCGYTTIQQIPATGMHDFINGACSVCSKKQPTEGLRFVLSSDGSYYECAGMGTATATNIVIADYIDDKPVMRIRARAFLSRSSLQSIIIGDNVTSIGEKAFYDCDSLQSVTIGNSVTSIGDDAFDGCNSLQRVEYTGTIDQWAMIDFVDYSTPLPYAKHLYLYNETSGEFEEVTEVNLTTATYISDYAFSYAQSITKVTIGDSVTSIGDYAFGRCSSLRSIVIPDGVASIKHGVFLECVSLRSVVIPCTVTNIGQHAFGSCDSLQSIEIPNSVTNISNAAFRHCPSLQNILVDENNLNYKSIDGNLYSKDGKTLIQYAIGKTATEFIIPDTVTSIGLEAFWGCTSLQSIVIPDSVTSIGGGAFSNCTSLESIVIPDSVTSIGEYAFGYCVSLQSIVIPDGVASIKHGVFLACESLQSIVIPNSVTSIGSCAFDGCDSLQRIVIPNSITNIGDYVFRNCAIEEATMPTFAINYIPHDNLKKVVITSGESIESETFKNCTSLQSIEIPDSVTSIGEGAFSGCTSLQRVEYTGTIDQWAMIDFVDYSSTPLYYANHLYLYNETSGEFEEVTEVNLTTATYISDYAFYNADSITKVTIPDSVTSIGDYAFRYCTSLQSIEIPDSVTSIGGYAFSGCDLLQSVTIGNGVTSIGYAAFGICSSLQSIEIPDSVTSIGGSAFAYCRSLQSIVIPDSVTSIGAHTFGNCDSLQSIVIPDSVTSIGNDAFYGCYKLVEVINKSSLIIEKGSSDNGYVGYYALRVLNEQPTPSNFVTEGDYTFYKYNKYYLMGYTGSQTELTLPESVDGDNSYEIYKYAFYRNGKITSVIISDGVTSIGSYAFYVCDSLQSVIIGNGVTSIGDDAFYWCSSLQSVTIGNGVTSIETSAFSGCYKLVEVINKSSLTIEKGSSDNGYVGYYALRVLNEQPTPSNFVMEGDYTFYKYENKYYLMGYTGSQTELTLPESVDGDNSYEIYRYAFYKNGKITSVIISDGVTSIGGCAFYGCTLLQSIEIPDSVTSIGGSAFDGCTSLQSIVIPDSVTSIGYAAFANCASLQSVKYTGTIDQWAMIDFGDSSNPLYYAKHLYLYNETSGEFEEVTEVNLTTATYISDYAFFNAQSITKVTIGDSVTSIENRAFRHCPSLQNILVDENNLNYKSIDGNLYSKDGKTLIQYAIGKTATEFVIPDSVTSIGYYAFYDCYSLQSVTIGNGVTSIGNRAFYDCYSLQSVTIGNSVTSIGDDAFRYCLKLVEVINKSSLTIKKSYYNGYVGYYALRVLNEQPTPSNFVTEGDYTFYKYENKYYLMGYTGSQTELTLPESVDGDNSYEIYKYAFYENGKITSVIISDGVTSIGYAAFANCASLQSVTIGNSVTSIGAYAFDDCTSLQSVTIGNGVTSIGNSAFYNCSSLQTVYYTGRADKWNNISIDSHNPYLTVATRYYYSESEPALNGEGTAYNGNYWHYVDGIPTVWIKE